MESRLEAMREYARGALWVLPGVSVVLALALGSVLSRVDVPAHSALHRLVFQGTSDDARTLLVGIAGTMITVIALMLGLTVVALQLSSTQYSPRLLRNFLRDRPNQLVLSAFVATFAYSTAGLYTVGVSGGNRTENFPRLAVSGAILLLFLSLFALVFEVHHVAHSMQVDEIMRRVENGTQQVIRDVPAAPCEGPPPTVPASAVPVRAARSGYVQTIHPEALVEAAGRLDVNVAIAYRVGEHVVSGTPLAWAWRSDSAPVDVHHLVETAQHAVRLGFERTLEQDAAFGIRQLVDIASKALSPAVNDPYTAVQAIDHVAVIMASIARREHGTAVRSTAAATTVTIPAHSFEDYLDLSCAQIRRFGAKEPTVAHELIGLLSSTAHATDLPARHAAIGRQLDLLVDDAEREVAQRADLVAVRADAAALRAWLTG
ncbi:MAG: DUF2254 domain-containing protein [Jatrophihabitantaceae bacterium]